LSLAKVLGDTFKLSIRHFVILCLVGLIVVGIPAIIQIYYVIIPGANVTPFAIDDLTVLIVSLTLLFFGFLAQGYVPIVAIRQCLHTARGGTGCPKGLMFPPLFTFLNMIGLIVIFFGVGTALLLPMAVFIPFVAFGGFNPGIFMLLMFAFALATVAVWLTTRFWLAQYFLVDQNTDCFDALMQAWEVSSDNFRALFGVFILFVCPVLFWASVGCFPTQAANGEGMIMETVHGTLILSVGFVPTLLIMWLGSGLAYLQLTEQPP